MATVRASCEVCGTVFVPAVAITVRMTPDEMAGNYEFCCPSCFTLVIRSTSTDTAGLLLKNGARKGEWDVPAEVDERPGGAPICHNDLIDFHQLVWDCDKWDQALSELAHAPGA